jgi:hypothetical protein
MTCQAGEINCAVITITLLRAKCYPRDDLVNNHSHTGLPDGLFLNQKAKFGLLLEGLAMEDVGIFGGPFVHFTVFCHILWTLGIVHGNWVYVFPS